MPESFRSRKPRARLVTGAVAGLLALLAGCATGLHPRTPEQDPPPAYDAAARGELPPAVLDRWWLLYEDPQLTSLVERALADGFDARTALARLREARALRGAALSAFAPRGDLQGTAEVRRTDDATSERASVSLPVSWELDLFGRRAATREVADADLAAARFQYEGTRAAVAAEVARTLFQARGLSAQLAQARANVDIQRKLLELLEIRVEHGLAAASQADRVAADVSQAEARVLQLEGEIAATRRALLVLLGDGFAPRDTVAVTDDIGAAPPVPATVPGDLLQRRPDIRQAEARVRAAAGNVRLAELDFYPRLTLQPGAGLSWQGGAVDAASAFWSLGLGLMLPVLDRPRLEAMLDVESARGQQAVIAYEEAVQTAYAEADQALVRLRADRARVQTLVEGEVRARRAYEAAMTRYRLGFSDLQVVLDAERAWRATRSALTDARIDALQRSVQVFQALGGGWPATTMPALPAP